MSLSNFEPKTILPMKLASFHPLLITASLGVASILTCADRANGATITETLSSTPGVLVPDNNLSGIVDTISVSSTNLVSIDKVTVTISLSGGWAGDLYAYLYHDGVTSILLNRPGLTAGTPAGSSASSITVTLDDAAATDIHDVAVGATPLVGSFQPDGRNVSPTSVTDLSPRTTTLADFIGQDALGDWSLLVVDAATGDTMTLTSWSVSLTGVAIPEPSVGVLGLLAGLLMFRRRR
jgi:subtilisin-like proprotein convertase family protein